MRVIQHHEEVAVGLFSWLFPKPADRIEKARKFMNDERYAEARMEVADLSEEAAVVLKAECEQHLVRLNLEKAVQRARAGEDSVAQSHLDLAERFHDGSMTDLFEETFAELAALDRAQRVDAVWSALASAAERRSRLGTDPGDFTLAAYSGQGMVRLFFGEGRPFNLPGLEYEPRASWFKPSWMEACKDGDTDVVLAAVRAAYPDDLASTIEAHQDLLVAAILDLADEAPEAAVQRLLDAPIEAPVIAFELGRAAAALGQHNAAFLAFSEAGKAYEGPLVVDQVSTQLWQAACALWAGDRTTALQSLDGADASGAPYLTAVIRIEIGTAEEAEEALSHIDEDDEQYPQLASVVRLKRVLATLHEDYPVLKDRDAQGTAEWNDAIEEMLPKLQTELDDVLERLKDDDPEEEFDEDDVYQASDSEGSDHPEREEA